MSQRIKKTIPATTQTLVAVLKDRPVLWVGAGASVAAGYPSGQAIIERLRDYSEDPIPPDLELAEVADRFVASSGRGALQEALYQLFREIRDPTPFHRALARLAGARDNGGRPLLAAIVTRNYDSLIERALTDHKVVHVVQTLEDGLVVGEDDLRVFKISGSSTDWSEVVLSGASLTRFDQRYQQLKAQLGTLLLQRPVICVGCAMTEPLLLDWLGGLTDDWAAQLDRWRPMMSSADWLRAVDGPWREEGARIPLSRGNIRPLVLDTENPERHLFTLWRRAADALAPRAGQLWRVPDVPARYLPRPAYQIRLVTALTDEGRDAHHGLHGMGGSGKSVLAAAVARDPAVRAHFTDGVYWLAVGQNRQITSLQAQLGRDLDMLDTGFDSPADGRHRLRRALAGKRALLVLDDIWDIECLDALDVVAGPGRMLVTTRNLDALLAADITAHALDVMTLEQARTLLSLWAAIDAARLPAEATEVAEACGRLPLALAIAGAMVRKPGGNWARVLRLLGSARLDKLRGKLPAYPYRNVYQAIAASVSQLVEDEIHERAEQCYADLAVFAEDAAIPGAALCVLWGRHGLDPDDTYDLASAMASYSLATLEAGYSAHPAPNASGDSGSDLAFGLRLHDIQHAYARACTGDMAGLHGALIDAFDARCPDGLARGPSGDEVGYFYRRLGVHLLAAGRADALLALLRDYQWLAGKLRTCSVSELLSDFERSATIDHPGARTLTLIRDAIRLASHVLASTPAQLPGQLVGRLASMCDDDAALATLLADARASRIVPWLCPLQPSLTAPGGPLLGTFAGHGYEVLAVALSADRTHALSGSHDDTLRLWDIDSGALVRVLRGHADSVEAVALSADRTRALSGSRDQTAKLWDIERGVLVRTLMGHTGAVASVALSADGTRALTGSADRTVKFWDAQTGALLHTFEGHSRGVTGVALSADATRALSGAHDRTAALWDTDSGALLRTLTGHAYSVLAVALNADGTRALTGAVDRTARLWNAERGALIRTFEGHSSSILSVALTADGTRVLTGSQDQTLKLWDTDSGALVHTFEGHSGRVQAVALSGDGTRALSGSHDKTVKLWDTECRPVDTQSNGHAEPVMAVAVDARGGLVMSASQDRTVRCWDAHSGALTGTLTGHTFWVTALASNADGTRVVSGSYDKTVRLWDAERGECLWTEARHDGAVTSVASSADGARLMSGSMDGTARLWDVSNRIVHTLEGHSDEVRAVSLSEDGALALSGSKDRTMKLWDAEAGELVRTFAGGMAEILATALSPDGKRALVGAKDRTVKLWDTESGALLCTYRGHLSWVSSVAFSSDGKRALSGSHDTTVRLWDLETGQMIADFSADAPILGCAMSAGDPGIAVAGDNAGSVHILRLVH